MLGVLNRLPCLKDGQGTMSSYSGSAVGTGLHSRTVLADMGAASALGGGVQAIVVILDTSTNGTYWRLNTPEFNDIHFGTDGRATPDDFVRESGGSTKDDKNTSSSSSSPPSSVPLPPTFSLSLAAEAKEAYERILAQIAGSRGADATAPRAGSAHAYVAWPAPGAFSLRQGTVHRGIPGDSHSTGYPFGDRVWTNNSWVDVVAPLGGRGRGRGRGGGGGGVQSGGT